MSAIEKWTDDEQITGMTRYAKAYSGSEFFKDAKSVEKAFVIISAGAEIGIAPFAAITGIALIQGKPVIGAGILAGLVKAHPKYDYLVKQLDDQACVLTFFQEGHEIGESSFTIDDAKRAGLAGKDVWKNYPRNMLFARAISNGVAFFTPDVTTTRVYTEGELDEVPEPAPRRKRERAAATTTQASPQEQVVDAEIVVDAPVAPETAESGVAPRDEPASTTIDPVAATTAVLKGMAWDQLKLVKTRLKALGIPWDGNTPAALVAKFAGDDDGLIWMLKADANGEMPSAEKFDQFISENTADATLEDVRDAMAAAGQFGS
jgi:hypothetical protein